MPPVETGQSGAVGLEHSMATGRALTGIDQHEPSGGSGGMPPMPTTTPGTEQRRREGEALPGGVVTESASVEGFVTPRSQQGLPAIAETVEGFPGVGLQLMSRVGDFFRVARTAVMQVPVWQDTHVTPPRSATRSLASPGGAPGQLALGDGFL